ncbi:MAG: ABC transporter permease [Ferruginibacter sp.]|nr:ABC transporter permease [Cytophagales bacterium]
MLHHYLTTAFRNLRRHRVFSFVNILGLALGIAASLLILEYVGFERSFNRFHANLPTLYRLQTLTAQGDIWTAMAPALAPLAKREFPEVKAFCRIAEQSANGIVTFSDEKDGRTRQSFREGSLAYADGSFFTLFTFPLRRGTAATALTKPNTAALSVSQARKYFGNANPVGRVVTLNSQFGKTLYTITAVYADMPANSDLRFDMVFSLETLANPANLNGNDWARLDGFEGSYLTTFLQLTPRTDYRGLEAKFNELRRKREPGDENRWLIQPATQLHLASSLGDPYRTTGSLGFVYLLSGIAFLILGIAWFNYINLSTAGALKRAKEVGVRKVVGAGKGQLIGQFLGESLLLNLFGFGLALLLVGLAQGAFNTLIEQKLSLAVFLTSDLLLLGFGLLVMGTLASGGYIAFVLSSFEPIYVLKGATLKVGKGAWLRKSLVVFQFGISAALMVGTVVLHQQLRYMQNKNLGVSLAQRVVIEGPQVGKDETFKSRTAALENELSQLPYVKNYSNTGIVPGNYYNFSTGGITRQNPRPGDEKKTYSMGIIDHRFLPTYGIGLAAGRNFTAVECEKAWEKSAKLMINETAARQLGFVSAAEAVGGTINWGQPYEVVGVVQDYHHQGLRQAIDPVIFMPSSHNGYLTVQLTTDNITRKIAELENLYKATYPGNPFEFFFVDERYNQQYKTEQQYGQVFTIASGLAIFIACLGLFGLATYTAEQRTKEIGIRKVLGASVPNIVGLLAKDFLKLVLLANVVTWPLAWYGIHRWLADFAYPVEVSGWWFALAGGLALLIAGLTIGLQTWKAARANPVKLLRSE